MAAVQNLNFSHTLYRYFFFDWLFKDVRGHSDVFERAAALRHNRDQARWLPVYLLRWLWLGLALYSFGVVAELVLEAFTLSSLLYLASAMSVSIIVAIAMIWVALRGARRKSH